MLVIVIICLIGYILYDQGITFGKDDEKTENVQENIEKENSFIIIDDVEMNVCW